MNTVKPNDQLEEGAVARRAARAEAAAWLARLHGPSRSPRLEAAFRHWLNESAQNAAQFEYLTGLWDLGKAVSTGGTARMSHRHQPYKRTHRALAAGVLTILAVGGFAAYRIGFANRYSTDVGVQLALRMKDGTRITLNSGSALETDYSDTARHIRLRKGEALFEVAKDPKRPFTVAAGHRTVTALGTSFVVRYDPKWTAITLVEGKVAVSVDRETPQARPEVKDASVNLAPGQRLMLTAAKPPYIDTPRIDVVTAWRRGEVVLEKTTLAEAVDEMNRYDDIQLVIDTPQIQDLKISGIYQTGDSRRFAQTISQLYGLRITQTGNRIRLAQK